MIARRIVQQRPYLPHLGKGEKMKNKIIFALILALGLSSCGNSTQKTDDKTKDMAETKQEEVKKDEKDDMKDSKMEEEAVKADDKEKTESVDASKTGNKMLPDFTSKDQDGNPYSKEDIAKNDATVINLWFTGCSACVEEMDDLNEYSKKLKEQEGVDFVSMCTDVNYDDSTKEAFERIMKDKKPTYKNLAVDYEGEIKNFLENIFVYPTTIVVDKNGNVIGDPVEGALNIPEQQEKLQKNIDAAIESSKMAK